MLAATPVGAAEPWSLASHCRAPSGDSVLSVTNPGDAPTMVELRRGDGLVVGHGATPGASSVTVPWAAATDSWILNDGSADVASVTVGNRFCITTEVRVERLRYACDAGAPTIVGYEVVDNAEAIELVASPATGDVTGGPVDIALTLTPGTYSTSLTPSSFTVHDGGPYHFGAVVRYDAARIDCADPTAPQAADEPDVYAQLEEYWNETLGDAAPTAEPSVGGVGDPSPAAPLPVATDAGPGAVSPPPAPVVTPIAPAGGDGRPSDTLPVTGGSVWLATIGALMVTFGGALRAAGGHRAR